jgi:hypothetical protein
MNSVGGKGTDETDHIFPMRLSSLVFVSPSLLAIVDLGAHLLGVKKLSALGGRIAFLDFGGDIRLVVRKPLFLLMQHLNSLLDEFIRGSIRAAFHVLLDKGFQLGL